MTSPYSLYAKFESKCAQCESTLDTVNGSASSNSEIRPLYIAWCASCQQVKDALYQVSNTHFVKALSTPQKLGELVIRTALEEAETELEDVLHDSQKGQVYVTGERFTKVLSDIRIALSMIDGSVC